MMRNLQHLLLGKSQSRNATNYTVPTIRTLQVETAVDGKLKQLVSKLDISKRSVVFRGKSQKNRQNTGFVGK